MKMRVELKKNLLIMSSLFLLMSQVSCNKAASSEVKKIGTKSGGRLLVVQNHYKIDNDLKGILSFISNGKANLFIAEVKDFDGLSHDVIYAAENDFLNLVPESAAVKAEEFIKKEKIGDEFVVTEFCSGKSKVNKCDLDWIDFKYTLSSKDGKQDLFPLESYDKTGADASYDFAKGTLTVTFDSHMLPVDVLELNYVEYSVGVETDTNYTIALERYNFEENKRDVSLEEFVNSAQISISHKDKMQLEDFYTHEDYKITVSDKTVTINLNKKITDVIKGTKAKVKIEGDLVKKMD